jgi:hypothetical protein
MEMENFRIEREPFFVHLLNLIALGNYSRTSIHTISRRVELFAAPCHYGIGIVDFVSEAHVSSSTRYPNLGSSIYFSADGRAISRDDFHASVGVINLISNRHGTRSAKLDVTASIDVFSYDNRALPAHEIDSTGSVNLPIDDKISINNVGDGCMIDGVHMLRG